MTQPESVGKPPLTEDPHEHVEDALSPRLRHVFVLAVLVLAVVGFFAGIDTPKSRAEGTPDVAPRVLEPGGKAPRGQVLGDQQPPSELSANADWGSRLPAPPSPVTEAPPNFEGLFPEGLEPDEQRQWDHNRQDRATRRAYAGAPPRVPHGIDQMSSASCVACHEHGLVVGSVRAPRMSHELMPNCTQCHVEAVTGAGPPGTQAVSIANAFQGLPSFGKGTRAYPGAPPTVPHPIDLRTDCLSCHGDLHRDALSVTHPWRRNCLQCHAPNAKLDQRVHPRPAGSEAPR